MDERAGEWTDGGMKRRGEKRGAIVSPLLLMVASCSLLIKGVNPNKTFLRNEDESAGCREITETTFEITCG